MLSRFWHAVLFLVALPVAPPATATGATGSAVQVALSRQGENWEADFKFALASPVWLFRRTQNGIDGVEWRSRSFNVLTPGIFLARVGHYDALFRADDRPIGRVRIRIAPYSGSLNHDYAPVLTFSDGGEAFYTGHFAVLPKPTLQAVAVLPADLEVKEEPGEFMLSDPGHRVLIAGRASTDGGKTQLSENGTYVYTGTAVANETPYFSQVIDPRLPGWARSDLDAFLPKLIELYTRRLGTPSGHKPMALIAWGGAMRGGYSQGGSVMPGLVAMALSGKMMETPNPKVETSLHWFLGHETSHFWLGQTIGYDRSQDGWITEGGADFLSITAIKDIDSAFDDHARWQQQLDDCLTRAGAGKPLAEALARGDGNAQYSCGSLLMLSASFAMRRRDNNADAFGFIRHLIDLNRSSGNVTENKWLVAFSEVVGDETTSDIKMFIDDGVPDPVTFWQKLFSATGVPYQLDGATLKIGKVS